MGSKENEENQTSKPNPPKPSGGNGKAVVYGMIAGIITGTNFGFIMNNIVLGVAIGTGVRIMLGAGFTETKRPK